MLPRRSAPEGDADGVSISNGDQGVSNSMVLSLTQAATYLGISKAHLSNVINRRVRGVPPLRCHGSAGGF